MGANIQYSHIKVFGLGNPLLDLTANVDDDFLNLYKLRKNSAVLAATRHKWLIDKLTNDYDIQFIAGGATQNTIRYCQWVLGTNRPVTAFVGAVGNDYFGTVMKTSAILEGINVKYMVVDGVNTGTCAVLFTDNGSSRSLCANLGASAHFNANFLLNNFELVENSSVICTSGHMLPVSPESVMLLAKHAYDFGKDFFFNLAPQRCVQYVMDLMPYIDFLFANRTESLAFASFRGYKTRDLKEIAKLIALEPKMTHPYKKTSRIVVITQGKEGVLMARSDSDEVKEYPAKRVSQKRIRDSNSCGDAFMGGFIAMHILKKSCDDCVRCAIYCAAMCLQQPGCTLPVKMSFKTHRHSCDSNFLKFMFCR